MIYNNIKYHGTYCNNQTNTFLNNRYTTNEYGWTSNERSEDGWTSNKRSYVRTLSFPYCGIFRQ